MMAAGKQGNNGVVPESYTCEVKSPVRHLAGSLLKQNKTKKPSGRAPGRSELWLNSGLGTL